VRPLQHVDRVDLEHAGAATVRSRVRIVGRVWRVEEPLRASAIRRAWRDAARLAATE
jgi:hypothetical protein